MDFMAHSAERVWDAVPVASSTDVCGKRDITTLNEASRERAFQSIRS